MFAAVWFGDSSKPKPSTLPFVVRCVHPPIHRLQKKPRTCVSQRAFSRSTFPFLLLKNAKTQRKQVERRQMQEMIHISYNCTVICPPPPPPLPPQHCRHCLWVLPCWRTHHKITGGYDFAGVQDANAVSAAHGGSPRCGDTGTWGIRVGDELPGVGVCSIVLPLPLHRSYLSVEMVCTIKLKMPSEPGLLLDAHSFGKICSIKVDRGCPRVCTHQVPASEKNVVRQVGLGLVKSKSCFFYHSGRAAAGMETERTCK